MKKDDILNFLVKMPYVYILNDVIMSECVNYKQDNYNTLREIQKEMPELRIYEDVKKIRLIQKL